MALSKADLVPWMDVFAFRDLLVAEASEDIEALRQVLMQFAEAGEAMSVGEDFVLLSSARFGSSRIEVTQRVGIDLVLPIAAILPFERHTRWAQAGVLPRKVAEDLVSRAGALAAVLGFVLKIKPPGPLGVLVGLVGTVLTEKMLNDVAAMAIERIKEANARALARKDFLAAALNRFRLDLDEGERERVMLRSQR